MDDRAYMERALELSLLAEGHTDPNPMVGAVIVKNNKIIGEGYHMAYGGPHAEVNALKMAGNEAKDSTIYVTLEPCAHYGKTPPCAKKLIEVGIKKCVVSILDPNPLVAGKGIKMLKDAGIEVEVGLLSDKAKEINRVFLKYIVDKIPYLFLKCAITLDGKIATSSGNSKWITNDISRAKVQKLRNKYMSIMVGINTLLADDPSLNARVENGVDPYRIVIDPHLRIKTDLKFTEYTDGKSIVVTSEANKNNEKIKVLEEKNIKIIYIEGMDLSLKEILKKIGELKIDSVLLEGGSYLISKAFKEDLIDGGEIFIAPKILGDDNALPFVKGFDIQNISDGIQLKNVKFNTYGDNVSVEFYK